MRLNDFIIKPSFPGRRESNFVWLLYMFLSWIPACVGMTTVIAGALISIPAQAEIIIGVAGPMTGQYTAFGEQMVRGAQAAIDDINAKGGISGELLSLDVVDDGCDVRRAEEAARGFVSSGVAVVISEHEQNRRRSGNVRAQKGEAPRCAFLRVARHDEGIDILAQHGREAADNINVQV